MQMRKRMELERIDTLRKKPLNVIRRSSISPLKINNVSQVIRKSTTRRILENADITDARVAFQIQHARQEKRQSTAIINDSSRLILKGAKLFNTGGGALLRRGPIVPVPFELQTSKRAFERGLTIDRLKS